jgi:hypothetical protein
MGTIITSDFAQIQWVPSLPVTFSTHKTRDLACHVTNQVYLQSTNDSMQEDAKRAQASPGEPLSALSNMHIFKTTLHFLSWRNPPFHITEL